MDLPTPPTSSSNAPTYPLSKAIKSRQFTTIEYPAPISRASASLESALSTLSPPLSKLSDSSTTDTPIEMDLEPKNPYFHKVPASSLNVNNIVVKLTKRTRKVPKRDEQGNVIETGQYKIEPIGVEHRVHRFRGKSFSSSFVPSRALTVQFVIRYGRLSVHPKPDRIRPYDQISRRDSNPRQ